MCIQFLNQNVNKTTCPVKKPRCNDKCEGEKKKDWLRPGSNWRPVILCK